VYNESRGPDDASEMDGLYWLNARPSVPECSRTAVKADEEMNGNERGEATGNPSVLRSRKRIIKRRQTDDQKVQTAAKDATTIFSLAAPQGAPSAAERGRHPQVIEDVSAAAKDATCAHPRQSMTFRL